MSFIVLILSLLQVLRMLIDGIYNLITKKYLFTFFNYQYDGWWYLAKSFDLSPEEWGIFFIIYAIIWLIAIVLFLFKKKAGRIVLMVLCLFTLWYFVWGALLSLLIFILNFFVGNKPILKIGLAKEKS